MAKLTKANLALLAVIVAAGANGTFAAEKDVKPLAAELLVEINPTAKDATGNVAVRALQKGIDLVATVPTNGDNGAAAGASTAPVSKFVIEDNVPVPEATRAAREATYPFDALQKGQSFFVPNTEAKPDAAKSLASTVSSANLRYSKDDLTAAPVKNRKTGAMQPAKVYERKFVVRSVEGGARVWRTQ